MNKYFNKILFSIGISLLIGVSLIATFFIPLFPFDELWNFQNVFKMYNNFKIYNDSNVIITPLFFYIENIIFHIFSPTIFTFRISNIFFTTLYFIFLYKLMRKLAIHKNVAVFFTLFILYNTFYLYVSNGITYNTLAILFYLIGLYYYFSNKNSNYIQGFIIFIIFFTKQTTGIFYALASIIYELYKYKFSKTFFKNQLQKFFTFLIPTTLVLVMLWINGNITGFFNYAFGGLFEFSKNNFSISAKPYNIFIIAIAYILSISILIYCKKLYSLGISKSFFEKLKILIIFASCISLMVYPIFNKAHTYMILPFFIIIIAYIFNEFFKDIFENMFLKNIFNILSICTLILLFIDVVYEFVLPYSSTNCTLISDTSSPYFGITFEKSELNNINTLKNYISLKNSNGTDVIICSSYSAYVMIPLKQSHGAYDLILYGNLGYNGTEKMKQDILSKEFTEFLIKKDYSDECDQFIIEITDFIKENLTKCGELLDYDVYTK